VGSIGPGILNKPFELEKVRVSKRPGKKSVLNERMCLAVTVIERGKLIDHRPSEKENDLP